ncbi:polymorphic toxin type 15 domain-containing protein [Tateyamaria armeniaca]|uniref:Polymorphic toxin type 15 domain-containing protein n=1 Tax=Tateyamaria armeniaca TaxID=2518930 RepID=A0ABW8UWS5_9RHOB
MGGSPHSADGLGNASMAAATGADRPVGLVAEECAAAGWVYAYYDDKWQTPLTMLPMTVNDINGAVIDEGGRTMGLPTFGMEDGQPIQSVRNQLGTQTYQAPREGRVLVEIGPDPGGPDPAALEAQIIADLQAFASEMETAIQPWVQQWEDEGWWGLIGSFFEKTGDGLSAWWEGEGEFWQAVWNWLRNLPDLAADAFEGAVTGAKELWDRRVEILSLIQYLAEGLVSEFEDGLELLLDLLSGIPGLEEIVDLLKAVVEDSAEWASAMIEMARETRVLTVLAGTIIGSIMMIPPNFWTDIVGLASGYLIPEVFMAIVFALIAFFSGGTLGGGLVVRLTAFVTKVTSKLAAAGRAGVVLIKIFDFLTSITSKMVDLIKALRRKIVERANGATGEATPVIRSTTRRVRDPDEMPCFNKPPNATDQEFLDQLAEQENAINNSDLSDLMERRSAVVENGTGALRDRAAQTAARDAWVSDRTAELLAEGELFDDAVDLAQREAAVLDATHVLDIVAGGDPADISGLQNRSVNRSLGSQWRGKVGALDDALQSQAAAGATKPNVRLRPC